MTLAVREALGITVTLDSLLIEELNMISNTGDKMNNTVLSTAGDNKC